MGQSGLQSSLQWEAGPLACTPPSLGLGRAQRCLTLLQSMLDPHWAPRGPVSPGSHGGMRGVRRNPLKSALFLRMPLACWHTQTPGAAQLASSLTPSRGSLCARPSTAPF